MNNAEQESQPLMHVSADIRRWDLLVFNLYMLPRTRANWIFFAAWVTLMYLLDFLFSPHDLQTVDFISGIVVVAIIVTVGFAAMFSIMLAITLFNATNKNGQIGPHVFTLRKDGLHEETPINESLNRWEGIHSVVAWKHGLYIRINWYLAHVIPASAFASRADFEKFSRLALELWTAAKSS